MQAISTSQGKNFLIIFTGRGKVWGHERTDYTEGSGAAWRV